MTRDNSIYRGSRRRGAAYVMVLSISLLVGVIGAAAITAARVQLRTADNTNDAEDARLLAQSGVEWARHAISSDPDWRVSRAAGTWGPVALGSGTFTVTVADPVDGNLANSPLDPLRVTATGYKGRARQSIALTLAPSRSAFSCLAFGMASARSINLTGGAVTGSGPVFAGGNVVLSGSAAVFVNAEAAGACSGKAYFASETDGAPARRFPDSSAFHYYIANGTAISYSATSGTINKQLLSPTSNPYGATNPLGIYVIDCGGKPFTLRNSRIVGTLVLLDPRGDSKTVDSVHLEPGAPGYPALMVRGSFNFDHNLATLSESSTRNMNPPGAPYNGVANSTANDQYPSTVKGLSYVSGTVTIRKDANFGGPVIAGGTINSSVNVTTGSPDAYVNNPPPGFFANPPMLPSASTWARWVDSGASIAEEP